MLRLSLFLLLLSLGSAFAQDVVRQKRGGLLRGKIEKIDASTVQIMVKLPKGVGQARRKIPMSNVEMIDFAPVAGERELLEAGVKAPKGELTTLWAGKRQHLGRPQSNAGAVGLQLGEILLASEDATDHGNARSLYAIIEAGDWSTERRALATRGRLQALVRLGLAKEVLAEARKIAEQEDDPQLLLDARHVMAAADLEKLRALVDENPKWREDDRIRPEIEALYHTLLDRFLEPFLFHGTELQAAARGLMHAADTYLLIEEFDRARDSISDVRKLYAGVIPDEEIEALKARIPLENHETTQSKE